AFSIPAGTLTTRYGLSNTLLFSLVAVLLSAAAIFFINSGLVTVVMVVVFALAYTALSVSSLPLAITKASYYEKVFCVGVFFSGTELPVGILDTITSYFAG
ncbi:MAG: hypothetical protein ACOYW3_02775, partial [Bacteroidota bacterium]